MRLSGVVRAIAAALFGVLGLPLLALLAIALRPSLLVNERTLAWGRGFLERSAKLELSWSRIELRIESLSIARKRLAISGEDVCVRAATWNACSDVLSLEGILNFSRGIPSIETIGPAHLQGASLRVAALTEGRALPTGGEVGIRFPDLIRGTQFQRIRIGFKAWEIAIGERTILGRGNFEGEGSARGDSRIRLESRIKARGLPFSEGRLTLDARNILGIESTQSWAGSADARAGSAQLRLTSAGDRRYRLRGSYSSHRVRARADMSAEVAPGRVRGVIDAVGEGPAPWASGLRISRCRFEVTRSVRLDCPIEAAVPLPPTRLAFLSIPARVGMRLTADLRTPAFPPDLARRWTGTVGLSLEPVLTPMLELEGGASAQVSAVPVRLSEGPEARIHLGLVARAPKFQKWVQLLRETPYAVPAPLNALEGSVELALSGSLDRKRGLLPVRVTTRLSSPEQRLNLDATGSIRFAAGLMRGEPLALSTQIDFSEVRVQLPRLSIEAPPRLLSDPRIARPEARPAAPAGFGYRIRIETPERPAELLSNLAQRPVPLNLRLELASREPVTGGLEISRFPLELFRRSAVLDHFRVSLRSPAPSSELNGLLKIAYADYTIGVDLLGTVGRPVIRLFSEPPLPEEQLVAVLLFGREISELDPEQNRSVGETRAALADGAIGLLSLYALASTPIESLGYDPLSGVISVKLRVAQGTSLSLGAGAGQLKTLGLRRRLGPHWTIETSLAPRQEEAFSVEERSVAQAFLEWSRRY